MLKVTQVIKLNKARSSYSNSVVLFTILYLLKAKLQSALFFQVRVTEYILV